jgi:hypothetical protein
MRILKATYTAPKSDRGRLVRKYWEKKSASELSDALGRASGGRGIYVLYKGRKVYYVGLSKVSIRSRLRSHAKSKRHKGKWNRFSFYQIGKTRYIKDVESLLLRIIQPKGNSVSGKFRSGVAAANQFNVRLMRKTITRLPITFGVIHLVLIGLFAIVYCLPARDPNHGMLFIFPALVDPVILFAHRAFPAIDDNVTFLIMTFVVLGTLQWWLVGYLIRFITLGLFFTPNQSKDPAA